MRNEKTSEETSFFLITFMFSLLHTQFTEERKEKKTTYFFFFFLFEKIILPCNILKTHVWYISLNSLFQYYFAFFSFFFYSTYDKVFQCSSSADFFIFLVFFNVIFLFIINIDDKMCGHEKTEKFQYHNIPNGSVSRQSAYHFDLFFLYVCVCIFGYQPQSNFFVIQLKRYLPEYLSNTQLNSNS